MTENTFSEKKIQLIETFNNDDIIGDLEILLKKNENVIKAYLARQIYTSNLSPNIELELENIYQNIRKDILK